MSNINKKQCRSCRSVGKKLYLKGARCFTHKCPITKLKGLPGESKEQGRRTRTTRFKEQWIEKRKVLSIYGLTFNELKKYFIKTSGAESIVEAIELRLDNIVFRCGFASSRKQARQIVNHGLVTVNRNSVNVPSYLVAVGDVIAIDKRYFDRNASSVFSARAVSESWIEKIDSYACKVFSNPVVDDLLFNPKLVVEFLSR